MRAQALHRLRHETRELACARCVNQIRRCRHADPHCRTAADGAGLFRVRVSGSDPPNSRVTTSVLISTSAFATPGLDSGLPFLPSRVTFSQECESTLVHGPSLQSQFLFLSQSLKAQCWLGREHGPKWWLSLARPSFGRPYPQSACSVWTNAAIPRLVATV
ncbi:hypothetical protein P154DRAFT_96377 [Amniculicola lignicola CBS 123094]|uniref:Uncharacterized protein n=1 Tax=Amniculicola lignicola CBS 123094 TaxID=1392246 RepID=A0A6A5VW09_9PLEO|nr:hypothetical protein P154DRAFT_96377 [Amniculicola lignicola CBS 123094]